MSRSDDILAFIRDSLLDDDDDPIEVSTSLFEGRVLDSMSLLELIAHLEKSYGIKVATTEVNVENLDTVDRIVKFLEARAPE